MSRGRPQSRRDSLLSRVRALLRAIRSEDDEITEAFLRLTRSHRALAPLAFTVGAFAMLLQGLRLLLTNWRLLLIQIPPAVWIWAAMFDLKLHVLHGKSFNMIRGPILIPIGIVIVALTAGSFFLNAVFAFTVAGPRPPRIGEAFARARAHPTPILLSGVAVGLALAVATTVAPRWGPPWFALLLGLVVAVMMVCYVAVPARLTGVRTDAPRRERLTASLLSTVIGVTVCTPPYVLGRIGILMLGSNLLLVPGIVVLVLGVSLQAGATGAVRAIKLSTALMTTKGPVPTAAPGGVPPGRAPLHPSREKRE